jgi:hypothetical protein
MKKVLLLVLVCSFLAALAKAQDVISLTNGSQIQAKVLEITPSEVKYKDFNNQDGPVIVILKSTVSSIKYANGTQTLFNESNSTGEKPSSGHFERGNGSNRDRGRGPNDPYVSYRKKSDKNARLKGWYFGADLNLGVGWAGNTDASYSTSAETGSGFDILATKMFNPHVGLQFGIGEDRYNYGVNFGPASSYYPSSDLFNADYFSLPVRVVYFSNSKKPVGFYGIAGVNLSLLAIATDNENDDLSGYYKSTLITPYVSAGVAVRTRYARAVWMFGLFYRTSAGNFYSGNSDSGGLLSPGNSGTINSFGFTVNYMKKMRAGRR